MNDTAQFEYSLAAAVCLDPKRVLQLRQIVSVEDFSISACAYSFWRCGQRCVTGQSV